MAHFARNKSFAADPESPKNVRAGWMTDCWRLTQLGDTISWSIYGLFFAAYLYALVFCRARTLRGWHVLGTPLATKDYPVKLGSQHLLTTHREFGCVPCALNSRYLSKSLRKIFHCFVWFSRCSNVNNLLDVNFRPHFFKKEFQYFDTSLPHDPQVLIRQYTTMRPGTGDGGR